MCGPAGRAGGRGPATLRCPMGRRRRKGGWCCSCWDKGQTEDVDALHQEIEFLEGELQEAQKRAEQRSLQRDKIIREKDEQIKNLHVQTVELEGFLKLADHSFLNEPVRVVVADTEGTHVLLERFFTLAPEETTTVRDFFEREACPHMRHKGAEVARLLDVSVGLRPRDDDHNHPTEWERASRAQSIPTSSLRLVQIEDLNDPLQRYTKMGLILVQFFVESKDVLTNSFSRIRRKSNPRIKNGSSSPSRSPTRGWGRQRQQTQQQTWGRQQAQQNRVGRQQAQQQTTSPSRKPVAAARTPMRGNAAYQPLRDDHGANGIGANLSYVNGHCLNGCDSRMRGASSTSVLGTAGADPADRQPKSPFRRILPRRLL